MHSWKLNSTQTRTTRCDAGTAQEPLLKFELRESSPGYVVLTCHGGLSWEDRELLAASVEQFLVGRESPLAVVLDMRRVEFVNSAGLGALFQLVQRLRSRRGHLAFANLPPAILRLLSTVGMERLAQFAEDVPQALTLLAQSIGPQPEGTEKRAPS